MEKKNFIIAQYLVDKALEKIDECNDETQCAAGLDTQNETVESLRETLNTANVLLMDYSSAIDDLAQILYEIKELMKTVDEAE